MKRVVVFPAALTAIALALLIVSSGRLLYAFAIIGGGAVLVVLLSVPTDLVLGVAVAISEAIVIFVPFGELGSRSVKLLAPVAISLIMLLALTRRRGSHNSTGTWWAWWAWLLLRCVTTVAAGLAGVFFYSQIAIAALVTLGSGKLNSRERHLVMRTTLNIATFQALMSVWEEVTKHPPVFAYPSVNGIPVKLPSHILGATAVRAQGTLGHPLLLSLVLLVGFVICLTDRAGLGRARRVLLAALMIIGIVCSGSIGTLVALLIVVVVWLSYQRSIVWKFNLCAAGALTLIGLIALGDVKLSSITNIFAEQEYSHRVNSFNAIGDLLTNQSVMHTLFGNGFNSATRLFVAGVIPSVDTFYTIDNQYTTLLATTGLIGFALFAAAAYSAARRCDGVGRLVVVSLLLMFLSFDLLEWAVPTILFITVTYSSLRPTAPASEPVVQPIRPARVLSPRTRVSGAVLQ